MPIPAQTKTNFDAPTDNPKISRAETATNIDIFNSVLALLQSGTAGQFLKSMGNGNDPVYSDINPTIANNSLSLSKLEIGTANNVIGYDANGGPTSITPAQLAAKLPDKSIGITKLSDFSATDAGKVLGVGVTGVPTLLVVGGTGLSQTNYLHVQHTEVKGVHGGTSAKGWNKRKLNEIITNNIIGCTITDNLIALPIGTYYVDATAAVYNSGRTSLVFGNISTNTIHLHGVCNYTKRGYDPSGTPTNVNGFFATATNIDAGLFHYVEAAYGTDGLGVAANTTFGTTSLKEVYVDLKIWKVS